MVSPILKKIGEILFGGVLALADYLSFHVLLCLVPAFFIAGAMVVFIPKDFIMKYVGADAKKIVAYPMAAIGGFLIAVCSCTVLPLFVGIKKKGAGLGPAITFLFAAPAVNILAITYTGVLISMKLAAARAVLALVFAILIGYLMELLFAPKSKDKKLKSETDEEREREVETKLGEAVEDAYGEKPEVVAVKQPKKTNKEKLTLTLQIFAPLMGLVLAIFSKEILLAIGVGTPVILQTSIWVLGTIALVIISFIDTNRGLNLFLWLAYVLFTGTSQINYFNASMFNGTADLKASIFNMAGKAVLTLIIVIGTWFYSKENFENEILKEWMKETWAFFKQIFPLIIVGVFVAGMLDVIIPDKIIENSVGKNSVLANLIGVLFGVFMYFPTLMEVPIAQMFLSKGMAEGVLLAYLLADPELSIQSILVTRKYIGDKQNFVYVLLVILFTVIAGLLYGLLIAGEPISLW